MTSNPKMHYTIRAIAGFMVLLSLAIGWWVTPWALLFTAFVGLNLLQSSGTHWCLMEDILRRAGCCPEDPAAHS